MTKLVRTFLILICSLLGLCFYVLAAGQEASASLDKELYNQSLATYRTTVGDLTEFFMDDYFSLQGWEKVPSKIGSQGIDGLYIKKNSAGRITQVLVCESKYGSSTLSMTRHGKQMSHEWVVQKIRELISKNERDLVQCEKISCPDLERLKRLRADLKTISKFVSQEGAYRRRLFRVVLKNGDLEFQSIDLEKRIIRPWRVSLSNPGTPEEVKAVKLFYREIKDGLMKRGLSGSEASTCINAIKDKVRAGEIKDGPEMQKAIIKVLYDCRIAKSQNTVSRQLYKCAQQYALLNLKIPERLRAPANVAVLAGAISSVAHGYKVFTGDESMSQAGKNIAEDTSLAGVSMYISEGVVQKIGDRIILTALFSESVKKALGAGAGVGLGVFIFDTTHNTYAFVSGNMSENDFLKETSKSLIKAAASGTAVYCVVLLGATPGGPVVMAVSIGAYIIVNSTLDHFERIQKRNFVTIEDIIWQLPIGIKVKKTAMDYELFVDSKSVLESNKINSQSVNDLSNVPDTSIMSIGDSARRTRSSESILDY